MGEFGRLPVVEGSDGRDHSPHGFTFWMAGSGVKAGTMDGARDEFGYRGAENPVRVADLHATLLHLPGRHLVALDMRAAARPGWSMNFKDASKRSPASNPPAW